jgi:hypothetical protein
MHFSWKSIFLPLNITPQREEICWQHAEMAHSRPKPSQLNISAMRNVSEAAAAAAASARRPWAEMTTCTSVFSAYQNVQTFKRCDSFDAWTTATELQIY